MGDSPPNVAGRPDDSIFDAAETWAGRRPARALVCELFVRIAQLAMMAMNIAAHNGLDDNGLPPDDTPTPPAPAPAV